MMILGFVAAVLLAVVVNDLVQRRHAILRTKGASHRIICTAAI